MAARQSEQARLRSPLAAVGGAKTAYAACGGEYQGSDLKIRGINRELCKYIIELIKLHEMAPFGQTVGTEIGLVLRECEVAAYGTNRVGADRVLRMSPVQALFQQDDVLPVAGIGPGQNLGRITVARRHGPMNLLAASRMERLLFVAQASF